ncbi:hypothetical protein [Acinetobacter sp. YH12255]|nr:hypothetical protein [Acinetobacter sp. YH12255]
MSALFGIAVIHFFALISPGPDFFLSPKVPSGSPESMLYVQPSAFH